MKIQHSAKNLLSLAAIIAICSISALAQCAMCKANIANAQNAAEVSRTINAGVLILLIPTLLIIGGIARLVYKYRHHLDDVSSSSVNSYVNYGPSDTQRDSQ